MSQQETYNPGLIKWSSELSLTCTPLSPAEVLHSCNRKQNKKMGKCSFLSLLCHPSYDLFYILSTWDTHWLANVTVSGRGIIMRSSPLVSASVTSLVQLSLSISEPPYHRRDAPAFLPPCPSAFPPSLAHTYGGTNERPALRLARLRVRVRACGEGNNLQHPEQKRDGFAAWEGIYLLAQSTRKEGRARPQKELSSPSLPAGWSPSSSEQPAGSAHTHFWRPGGVYQGTPTDRAPYTLSTQQSSQ